MIYFLNVLHSVYCICHMIHPSVSVRGVRVIGGASSDARRVCVCVSSCVCVCVCVCVCECMCVHTSVCFSS